MTTQLATAVNEAIRESMAVSQDQKDQIIESIEDSLAYFFEINLDDYEMVREELNKMGPCDLSSIHSLIAGSSSPLERILGCPSRLNISLRMALSAEPSTPGKLHWLTLEWLADVILAANPITASSRLEYQAS